MPLRGFDKMPHQCSTAEPSALLRSGTTPNAEAIRAAGQEPAFFIEPSEQRASARVARAIIKARAARRRFFDEHLFADPAWDMLLELYALNCEGLRISVSKLSIAAGVPGTTALRWIDKLEEQTLIERTDDPLDGRRVWIRISEVGFETMRHYLELVPIGQSVL